MAGLLCGALLAGAALGLLALACVLINGPRGPRIRPL
jgi:hypothetical protein